MSVITKDLGAVTAYGYAVEKGYTGTEEEFAELMASYATVGQTAVDAKDAAVAAKTAAQTAATTATNKASEATTAATTATTKAGEAQTSAQTASIKASEASQSASQALGYKNDAESAKTASQTAQGLAESAKDSAISAKNDAESARDDAESARDAVQSSAAQITTNAEDITQLKEDLDDLKSAVNDELYTTEIKPLYYDDITWTRGYLKADGSTVEHTAYVVSEYLPVTPGDSVAYDGLRSPSTIYPPLSGYDSNKNFVLGSNVAGDGSVSQSGTYTVPEGVSYIRVSTYDYDGTVRFNSITLPVTNSKLSIIDARINNINAQLGEVDERLDALEAESPMYQYTLGFDDYEYTTGKLASKDGEQTRSDGQVTDYISTENMISVSASNVKMVVLGTNSRVAVVACYDSNKNLLQNKTVFADGTYGQFVQVTASVTITSEIAYVRLSRLGDIQNTGTFTVTMERTFADDYDVTKAEVADIGERMNPWNGKNWFVFGTSMSDDDYPNTENGNKPTGVFPKYLEAISGMKQFNHGRAGGTISTDPTSQYHPTGQIYTEIINTDFSSADLITLEGFINDFAECVALGNLGDTTQNTFYGALYLCIKYLSEHNTNATIVVITDPVGKEYTFQHGSGVGTTVDYSSNKINAIGLRQVDYSNAIIKVCQWMGVHCIDVGGKSQINEYHPAYIVDQCHQTELGGKQFALTVWEELKNIHCNSDVVVD